MTTLPLVSKTLRKLVIYVAALLTTINLYCTSISSKIISVYYIGEFQEIRYAITLVTQCRLSDMRCPLREGIGYCLLVPL